jgi:hypothetical protein
MHKLDWLGEGMRGREMECVREWSPKCLGLERYGGRSDGHGQRRPPPGEVFGVGRFADGLGYGHEHQVLACQCGSCNTWEAGQLRGELYLTVRPFGVVNHPAPEVVVVSE